MKKSGRKNDSSKPDLTLIPYEVLEECAHVLGYGAKKYSRWNWQGGLDYSRVAGAAMRHLNQFMDKGETLDIDPKCKECSKGSCSNHSQRHHLGAAIVSLMFLLSYELNGQTHLDNRRPKYKSIKKTRKKK